MNPSKDYEFVSAAMDDDDLSEEMLDKLLSDDGAAQRWREYHMIRDCLQSARIETSEAVEAGISVHTVETVQTATVRKFERSEAVYAKPAANQAFKGFAVAASVLAVAVGVWQFWPQGGQGAANVAEKAAPADQAEIVSVGGKSAAKNDAVANAEAQGAVVPNAARSAQSAGSVEKQTAVRVEKLPEAASASVK